MSDRLAVDRLVEFIRDYYRTTGNIPLHAPVFKGTEKDYVVEVIESTFVSSVGVYVNRFEKAISFYTGCKRAVATVNGTAALHIALKLAGVVDNDLVITQPLTFVATCNAIKYCNADPVFVDVDKHTLGLSASSVQDWLEQEAYIDDQLFCRHRESGRVLRACLPMHTFGHPVDLDGLLSICANWNLVLVEDAAESLGSFYKGRHTGTFGLLGALSFNGNKIITTGGGGMILADEPLGERAMHLTTTAKQSHSFEFIHDEVGYNYRLPNLNAALGCAQVEKLEEYITEKRKLAALYADLFVNTSFRFVSEPEHCRSNYWLNAIICDDRRQRDELLELMQAAQIQTRPVWRLMNRLPMFATTPKGMLDNAEWLADRVVSLPSGVLGKR